MELGPIVRAMSRNKLRFGLIAMQIALTLAVLANCVALIQDARQKMIYPKTFAEDDLIAIHIPLQDAASRDHRRKSLQARELLEGLKGISGVRAVTSTTFFPFMGWRGTLLRPAGSGATLLSVSSYNADERFPDALGVEIDEGSFYSHDEVVRWDEWLVEQAEVERARNSDGKVLEPLVFDVVISRALGRHFFGEGALVGKMLENSSGDLCRIVGVIGTYYAPVMGNTPPDQVVFWPFYGISINGAGFMARAEPGQAAIVAPRIQEMLSKKFILADTPVHLVSEAREQNYAPQQMTVGLMGILIVLLLFVASLSIAGLTSFSVTARTRQIGTRRALGATTSDILRYFLTEAGLITTLGLFIGAALSVLLNMTLLRIYPDAKLGSAGVLGCALLLWLAALGAALPPALRASKISPAIATRNV